MTDHAHLAPLPPAWREDAADRFGAFRRALAGPPLIASHDDADGLSSAALLARALGADGPRPEVRLVGRGENAWSDSVAAEVAARAPPGLVVADLGMRARGFGLPLAVIDHHVPAGAPEGACVVHGLDVDPVPATALLALVCAHGVAERADDLLWLAAVGLIGDLGDKAPFDAIPLAKKRYGAGKLRELVALVNAPRRSASGDGAPALSLLTDADDPADALSGRHPGLAACEAARAEVKAALAEARRAPPRFGRRYGSQVALVRVDTPCQVHPIVAQSWTGRLKGAAVFAANFGYREGHVSFSGRGGRGADLISLLARHRPEGADPLLYGNGHARAAGGTLPFDLWNEWIADLGFGDEMRAG